MLGGQPKQTVSVLIGPCDGKEDQQQSYLQATGNLGRSVVVVVACGDAAGVGRTQL